jgi:hypothetical protein
MSPTQSVDLDELARMHSADECPLDRYDRYLVVPDGEKKPLPHTRATTVAKTLDDGYGVTDWKVRTTALGFALDPILYGRLCTLVPDTDADLDKAKLDALCEEAKKRAGGDDARDKGTILHAFSEKVDRGQRVRMPPEYQADIDAYRRKLDELEIRIVPELVERHIVVPGQSEPIAGKADRFVHFGSTLKTFDLKTGRVGSYSWLAFAIQLAIYSRGATFYNAKTKTHEPMPAIDQQTGLICHLPAGQATCDIYFIDLEAGWAATRLALAVREMRRCGKRGDLAEAWTSAMVDNPDVRRARLADRVRDLAEGGHGQILRHAWPDGVAYFKAVHEGRAPAHTADELDLIALAISTVENRLGLPFAAPDRADR